MNPDISTVLITDRLILRPFEEADLSCIELIFGNEEINRFLPWFPVRNEGEALRFFEKHFAADYRQGNPHHYLVLLRETGMPVGYVNVSGDESHEIGWGLLPQWQHQGLATEAAQAVARRLRTLGIPFLTATHDVSNPASGQVMKRLGMRYLYSYKEQWMPKNIPVTFRLYILDLDGNTGRSFEKYRRMHPAFLEDLPADIS